MCIGWLIKTSEIPSNVLTDIRTAGIRTDMPIRPLLGSDLEPGEFDRMDEEIEMGYQETIAILDARDIGAYASAVQHPPEVS
jgi:hypothetical protein